MVKGAFHSTQNSGNFIWYIKWKGQFRFGPTGIFGTSFEGGPLWPVWSFRSVGPKFPFPFDKIVVPNTALLYPAYKKNNQTRCGLGRVCVTGKYRSIGNVEFPKFQTANFCWSESTHSLHYSGLKCLQRRICNRKRKKKSVNLFKPAIHKNRYVLHPRPKYTSSHKAWLCTTSGPRKQNSCCSC